MLGNLGRTGPTIRPSQKMSAILRLPSKRRSDHFLVKVLEHSSPSSIELLQVLFLWAVPEPMVRDSKHGFQGLEPGRSMPHHRSPCIWGFPEVTGIN